jgi:hypothetical protein
MESIQANMEQVQAEQTQAEQTQAEQTQAEQTQAEQTQEQIQAEQVQEVPLKKYRAVSYDIHDETYANEMKKYSLPEEFHTFTDRLMDEPRINRYCLLNAIDEYKQAGYKQAGLNQAGYKQAGLPKLSAIFQDTAYNCRPYQVCVIC